MSQEPRNEQADQVNRIGDKFFESALQGNGLESVDSYCNAGNIYLIANVNNKASLAFQLAGGICELYHEKYRAIDCYHMPPNEAIVLLNKAIILYLDEEKFASVAMNYNELAKMQLEEKLTSDAINSFEQAYKYYEIKGLHSNASQCLVRAVELLVDLKEYEKALIHLCKIYTTYKRDKLTEYRCKTIFLEMGIIKFHLSTNNECRNFLIQYNIHSDTKEYQFLENLINSSNKDEILDIVNNDEYLFNKQYLDILKLKYI
jgi:hypothetical protein